MAHNSPVQQIQNCCFCFMYYLLCHMHKRILRLVQHWIDFFKRLGPLCFVCYSASIDNALDFYTDYLYPQKNRKKARSELNKSKIKRTDLVVRSFVSYCKNSFLNNSTHTRSIQPKIIPKGIVKILIISLTIPPFFKNVSHLTKISTISFTTGIRSKIICTKRLCLLNQVIFSPPWYIILSLYII